jgi:hypothetical protein
MRPLGQTTESGRPDGPSLCFSRLPHKEEQQMAEKQGIIKSIIDCGTVVQVFIDSEDATRVLAADGNMFRRAQEAAGRVSLVGANILFEETEWPGGMAWFSLAEDTAEGTFCANCRRIIGPHLNPNFCVFGKHPRRALKPSNGAHADE